jgi:hypothetical protein
LAPVDRICKALGPEEAARFLRAFADYAKRVEEIVEAKGSAQPGFTAQFHAGRLVEAGMQPDLRYR